MILNLANLQRERERERGKKRTQNSIIINLTTKPKNLKTQERDNSQSTRMEFWQTQLVKSLETKRETEREVENGWCEKNSGCSGRGGSSKNSPSMGSPQPYSLWRHNHSPPCLPFLKIQKQEESSTPPLKWLPTSSLFQRHLQQLP